MPRATSIEIADAGFAGWVLALHKFKSSGVVQVRAGEVNTFVYLDEGVPVFAEEGTLGETFGRVLLTRRMLTEAQYRSVVEKVTEAPDGSEQMRFGEACVALGFLTHEQVNEVLEDQVRRKVLRCFQWANPVCQFRNTPEALDEVAHYPVEVAPLVLEGVRRFYDPARVEKVVAPVLDLYPRVEERVEDLTERFRMKVAEAQFVSRIDGSRTTRAVLAGANLDPLHAGQVLCALVLADAIVLDEERPLNSMQLRAVWASTVAVPSDEPKVPVAKAPVVSTPSPVARAKAAVPAARRPEVPARPVAWPSLPRRVAPRAVRPAGASARASVPPPDDVKQRRLRAEALYQSGRAALREGLVAKALGELRRAADLHPEAKEYRLCAVWAELLDSKDEQWRVALRSQLDDLVREAVVENREVAIPHYIKAHLNLFAGDEVNALKCFRMARRLDPDDRDAERHYRVLSQRLKMK